MTLLLVPRDYKTEVPASFISRFQLAAREQSVLLDMQGIITCLIDDPPAFETVSPAQIPVEQQLLRESAHALNRVHTHAMQMFTCAATVSLAPELCSELAVSLQGRLEAVPLDHDMSGLIVTKLLDEGVASLRSADHLMSAMTGHGGFYKTLPHQYVSHFQLLAAERAGLLKTFGAHAGPGIPDPLRAELYEFYDETTEIGQRDVEINFAEAAYTSMLYSQVLAGLLRTAYTCLQPQGPFMKTYLRDRPSVTHVLQACGIHGLEGLKPC